MKNPRLRRIACVLAALVLLVALGVAYVAYSISNVTEVAEANMLRKLNGISSSFLRIIQMRAQIQSSYDNMLMSNVRLSVWPLRELAEQDGGLDIRAYDSGFVLRTDGDKITLPRELANSSINAQCFRDTSGNPLYTGSFHCAIDGSANDAYLCMFCSITDNYYYVDYTPTYERQEYVRSYVDITAILNQIETVLQGYVLLYVPDDGDNTLIFKSPFFEDCETLGETGINPNLPAGSFDTFTVNGTKCIYTLSAAESVPANVSYDHYRAVFAMPYDKATSLPPSRFIILLGVAALFFIVVISWILSVFALIRRGFVSESQRNQYSVVRVRRIIAGIGIVGALITVLTTMFSGALQLLYDKTMENQYLLNLMVAVDSQAKYDADIIKAHQEGNPQTRFFHRNALDLSHIRGSGEVEQTAHLTATDALGHIAAARLAGHYVPGDRQVQLTDLFVQGHTPHKIVHERVHPGLPAAADQRQREQQQVFLHIPTLRSRPPSHRRKPYGWKPFRPQGRLRFRACSRGPPSRH